MLQLSPNTKVQAALYFCHEVEDFEATFGPKHLEKVVAGEIEYKNTVLQSHKNDLKDEFVLILISIPILLLAWSVFSDDPDIQLKLDLFFERFNQFPMWFQALIVGAFSTILGVRGVSAFKKK